MATGLIPMRRALTFLTAILLLAGSLAIGALAADLPFWRRALQLPLSADSLYLPVATIGVQADPHAAQAVRVATSLPASTPAQALDAAVARARAAGSRALLVMQGGSLVLSHYFGGDDQHSLLPAGLIARPATAMAVGLALADRSIESLDQPVAQYLPEWDDEPRGRITLRQLLEDTSGLESGGAMPRLLRHSPWSEPRLLPAFATAKGVRMVLGNDFASTALRFDLEHEPGGFHHASPANPQLAALIVERATRTPFEQYLDERLWRALGNGPAELALDRRAGMPAAHCCWRATAPDMLALLNLLAVPGDAVLPDGWAQEMSRASRVNAASGMQLTRGELSGQLVLGGSDDDGSEFWVFPQRRLAILNIVNPDGRSDPGLPTLLLRALDPG
jgi:CubicO group peptidase (beta-lactamase class C family)